MTTWPQCFLFLFLWHPSTQNCPLEILCHNKYVIFKVPQDSCIYMPNTQHKIKFWLLSVKSVIDRLLVEEHLLIYFLFTRPMFFPVICLLYKSILMVIQDKIEKIQTMSATNSICRIMQKFKTVLLQTHNWTLIYSCSGYPLPKILVLFLIHLLILFIESNLAIIFLIYQAGTKACRS